MKQNKHIIPVFIVLQGMNILFSLNGILIKTASDLWEKSGLFAIRTIMAFFGAIALLGIYAFLWQQILSRVELTVAYMCKGMTIFWGMLWSFVFFQEEITFFNILGVLMIFAGSILVTKYE